MMNRSIIKTLLAVTIGTALFTSCKQDEYYRDSGTYQANFNGSILGYLKSKPQYFDSLTRIIDIAGMNNDFDKENITFYAPTNSSIYRAIRNLNLYLWVNGRDTVSKLEQIKPEAWRKVLQLYMFKGTYRLKDYPQIDTLNMAAFPGQGYTSINGRTMNIGVLYNDAVIIENGKEKSRIRYAGYRQLYLAYIPSFADPKVGLIYAPVASSDIAPTNGIVHVLASQQQFVINGGIEYSGILFSKHNLGFNNSIFLNIIETYGILPPTP